MAYLVVVTFDLKDAESEDYECVDKGLSGIGLGKTVTGNSGKNVDLPYNTYVGEFPGTDAATIAQDILDRVLKAMQQCKVNGRLFVAVGDNWAWRSNTF